LAAENCGENGLHPGLLAGLLPAVRLVERRHGGVARVDLELLVDAPDERTHRFRLTPITSADSL
jgi:hypothetical protein